MEDFFARQRAGRRRLLNQLALLGASALLPGIGRAQSDKPVSLIVGYSAGGSADLVARVVGTELSKRLGRQVIVENGAAEHDDAPTPGAEQARDRQ